MWWQAASYAGAAANEDRSDTQLTYRERKAAEGYPKYLEHVCGSGGSEGRFPFKIKRRTPSAGGNWTFELSKQERPKNGRGVYKQFTTARSTGRKYFLPLYLHFTKDGHPAFSGWTMEDVRIMIAFNAARQMAHEKGKAVSVDEDEVYLGLHPCLLPPHTHTPRPHQSPNSSHTKVASPPQDHGMDIKEEQGQL